MDIKEAEKAYKEAIKSGDPEKIVAALRALQELECATVTIDDLMKMLKTKPFTPHLEAK